MAQNEHISLTVEDDGIGFRPELLKNTRKMVTALAAPPRELASSFPFWRLASAPFALVKNRDGTIISRGAQFHGRARKLNGASDGSKVSGNMFWTRPSRIWGRVV